MSSPTIENQSKNFHIKGHSLIEKFRPSAIPFFLFFVFLAIYANTMFDGVGGRIHFGDSAELQWVLVADSVYHPSGAPLMMFIGKLFIYLLPMSPAKAVTSVSVFMGALAVMFSYLSARRVSNSQSGSVISACLLGFSSTFWITSTEAELYALSAFLISAVIYLFLSFLVTRDQKFLLAGCLVYALGFGAHLALITMLPALIYLVYVTDRSVFLNWRLILLILAFVIIGAGQFLYIYYLSHTTDPSLLISIPPKCTFKEFYNHITVNLYKKYMFDYSWVEFLRDQVPNFFAHFLRNFGLLGFCFIMSGIFVAFLSSRQTKNAAVFLLMNVSVHLAYILNYRVPDQPVFYVQAYIALVVFVSLAFKEQRYFLLRIAGGTLAIVALLIYNVFLVGALETRNQTQEQYVDMVRNLPAGSSVLLDHDQFNYHIKFMYRYYDASKELPEHKRLKEIDTNLTQFYASARRKAEVENKNYQTEMFFGMSVADLIESMKNHIVFLSVKDDSQKRLPNELRAFMGTLGSKIKGLKYRGSYAAIVAKSKILVEKISNNRSVAITERDLRPTKVAQEQTRLKGHSIYIKSAGAKVGDLSSIKIDGKEYSLDLRGLNAVVYNEKMQFLNSVAFDFFKGAKYDTQALLIATKKPE